MPSGFFAVVRHDESENTQPKKANEQASERTKRKKFAVRQVVGPIDNKQSVVGIGQDVIDPQTKNIRLTKASLT